MATHSSVLAWRTPGTNYTVQSMGFSRQEYRSGSHFHSPEALPNPGTEPRSPALQADSLPPEPPGKPIYLSAAAKSLQSCPTLCDPIDGSPPGSPVPGILQAGTLEWVAISFSNAWKWKGKVKLLSRVQLLATPWTIAHQALPSMGFSRQEYWSGVPLSLCPRSDIINICCIFDNTYKYL